MRADKETEKLYFVDSNVFFYAKIMDHEYGSSCAEVIRRVANGGMNAATSVLVTVEVANALRKFGLAREVKDEIDSIFSLNIHVLDLVSSDARNAIDLFQRHHISPYDCAHIAVMKRAGIRSIISADGDFDEIREIERKDPKVFS